MTPRIWAVILKECRDYRRNRSILLTMLLVPLGLVVIHAAFLLMLSDDLSEAIARFIVAESAFMVIIMPVMLSTPIAIHSIIGERNQRTLEPLLTSPISDRELLLGKALAAGLPALGVGWGAYCLFLLLAYSGAPPAVAERITSPATLAAVTVAIPVVAAYTVVAVMLISERSSDMRAAQQLAVLSTLPVIGLAALFTFGVIVFTSWWVVAGAGLAAALVLLGWCLLVRLFNRERLLTRHR